MLRRSLIGLLVGLFVGLVLVGSTAQGGPPGLETIVNAILEQHHTELTFSVAPGGSQSIALPETQGPVRIEVTFSLLNGGTQTPSEIMYAVVNQDPESLQMTWVGTNNDGSQQGSNSIVDTQIALIYGGGAPTVNAALEVEDLALGTVRIWQNPGTTILDGNYVVNLWY